MGSMLRFSENSKCGEGVAGVTGVQELQNSRVTPFVGNFSWEKARLAIVSFIITLTLQSSCNFYP
jgi:hypothetical protein